MSHADAAFYFDLASPESYLIAEQVLQALPGPAQWQPVLERELPIGETHEGFRCQTEREIAIGEVERRVLDLGLQPLRLPADFPFDSEQAMRVATYAKSIGRTVPFAQAAFRQAFAAGHSLGDFDFVLLAAAACEMHPRAVLQSAERDSVARELIANTAAAAQAGITGVPSIRVGEQVFDGEDLLEQAGACVRRIASGRAS
jgi:2-hydroxychromene-2-carboxylate isomerase